MYHAAQKEVDEVMNQLEKTELSIAQNKIVDRALSAANASGAAYGTTAYKQGLYDGIKLMSEINQISRDSSILNVQK